MKNYIVTNKKLYVNFVEGSYLYDEGTLVQVDEETNSVYVNDRETDDYASFHIKHGNIVPQNAS